MRILHCLRAPIGGLFRHVHDLAKEQAQLGLDVGIVCDASTGGQTAELALGRLSESCSLGIIRIPMSRQLGISDWRSYRLVARKARELGIDVLHGHGAKGGAYARLAGRRLRRRRPGIRTVYTPHGGSLHYSPDTLAGRLYLAAERRLAPLTDGLLFESRFAAERYSALIGPPLCPARIVPNGLFPHEFYEPTLTEDAADFVFVGELRKLKGLDTLLAALASVQKERPVTAIIAGGGPDEKTFKQLAQKLGLGRRVSFIGPQPARAAFARGRLVVVPSRAESFPYVVLEAAAAQMPLITTSVGGIPEMVAGTIPLLAPGDPDALAHQMASFLADPRPFVDRAVQLQAHVAERFTVARMASEVDIFYRSLLASGATADAARRSIL